MDKNNQKLSLLHTHSDCVACVEEGKTMRGQEQLYDNKTRAAIVYILDLAIIE